MVAHAGYDLLIVLRSPVPEGMLGIVLVSQVANVSSQNENISCYLQDSPSGISSCRQTPGVGLMHIVFS